MCTYQGFLEQAQEVEEAALLLKQRLKAFYHLALIFFDDEQMNVLITRAQQLGNRADLTAELVEMRDHLSLTDPVPDLEGMLAWVRTMRIPYLIYTIIEEQQAGDEDAFSQGPQFPRGVVCLGRQMVGSR